MDESSRPKRKRMLAMGAAAAAAMAVAIPASGAFAQSGDSPQTRPLLPRLLYGSSQL